MAARTIRVLVADGFLPKGELTTRLPSLLRTCSAASR